jgi:solute carrier family 6 GABA transporter-like protein 1
VNTLRWTWRDHSGQCSGVCAQIGHVLTAASLVYNAQAGLSWFIPYFMAVILIAIPTLMLELSIGQAHRAGGVVAYNALSKRLRGVGLGMLWVAFLVVPYFVVNLAWSECRHYSRRHPSLAC